MESEPKTSFYEPLVKPIEQLTSDEVEFYQRQMFLDEIGEEGQQRLKSARVLVVGAGGLGSPAIIGLARAGVGNIGVLDFDTVDISNLHRQSLHAVADVGSAKVDSALRSVAEHNPFVRAIALKEPINADNALEIISKWDLVIDGTDNFAARFLINDAAVKVASSEGRRLPVVSGAINRFDGRLSVFDGVDGPCYRCHLAEPPPAELAENCATTGVLGTATHIVGFGQAQQAIQLIVGYGQPLIGSLQVYDFLDNSIRTLRVRKDPDCQTCSIPANEIELVEYNTSCVVPGEIGANSKAELTADDLHELLQDLNYAEQLTILDVRESWEYAQAAIPGAVNIPLAQLGDGGMIEDLSDQKKVVVVYCKSGSRSLRAQQTLARAGVSSYNLIGGIDAYVF